MAILAVYLPLLVFATVFFFGKRIGEPHVMYFAAAGQSLAALFAIFVFWGAAFADSPSVLTVGEWFRSGDLVINWTIRQDMLAAVMLCVVNIVSALVHVYSIGYMSHDKDRIKFMSYLSLFTFMMLMLVSSNTMVQLFFGWEGVGLASYLLIGFWSNKDSANKAAIKAFVVNRVGDFALLLGMFLVFKLTGSLDFEGIFAGVAKANEVTFPFLGLQIHGLSLACFLLFLGAMGKSAQLGLHVWLPDAMEGPTPVSALIHAATMVTAGVFLMARISPMLEYAPVVLTIITIVGALTAFVAATIGMTQFDIKRVIAYSTMSQLGYMFFAIGVSAYPAAIFHLATHAFFKALLFLGAGSVIHAMSDEQDMRKMGGIAKHLPITHAMMWIGTLALAGVGIPLVIGLSGFYSKDIIIESAFAKGGLSGSFAFWIGVLVAGMTAFYSFRVLFMTFYGEAKADHHTMEHIHESPRIMTIPLMVLALGAVFAGILGYNSFVGDGRHTFWDASLYSKPLPHSDDVEEHADSDSDESHGDEASDDSTHKSEVADHSEVEESEGHSETHDIIDAAHHVPLWVKIIPVLAGMLGIFLSYRVYIKGWRASDNLQNAVKPLYTYISNKWRFDEFYKAFIVDKLNYLGKVCWLLIDKSMIDKFGPDGLASLTKWFAERTSRLESGLVYHYAFAMLLGIVFFIGWFVIKG